MASAAALQKTTHDNPKAQVIPIRRIDYPRDDESVRCYRLWDSKKKEQIQYRYYSDNRRAHMGALYEVRWATVGTTIEVFDVRNGKLLGQYTRRLNDIHFLGA